MSKDCVCDFYRGPYCLICKPQNKTTPEEVASPDKLSYLDNSIDEVLGKYMIRHPKVSISNPTARKMLKRDLREMMTQMSLSLLTDDERSTLVRANKDSKVHR